MQIWIDNDGCPKAARDLVFAAAARLHLELTVVANSYMKCPPPAKMVCVSGNFDAADDYIAQHVTRGDLVITSDIPLADRIVTAGATGLSARGEVFNVENISERLATRNLLKDLRGGGLDSPGGGPPPFSDADRRQFANALDRLLTALVKKV